ncbi:MAG: hypothetical protein AAGJ08_26780, partial [Cyanobacteria bacterium P01_H01_bin.35]
IGIMIIILFLSAIGFGGLQIREIKDTKYPNEGMWRSLSNGVLLTIITLSISVIMLLVSKLTNSELISAILLSLAELLPLLSLIIFYSRVIQHLTLRIIFFLTKKAPWNYARFLNYATEKMLLQRVGGGYRFIHRLLQERLAWRYENHKL